MASQCKRLHTPDLEDKFNAKFEEIEASLNSKADTDDTEAVLAANTNLTDFEEIHDRLKNKKHKNENVKRML